VTRGNTRLVRPLSLSLIWSMKTHARHNPILDQKLRTEVAKIGRPLVVADAEEETNRAALRSEQKLRGNELRIYSRWIGTAEELQLGREGDAASHLVGTWRSRRVLAGRGGRDRPLIFFVRGRAG
jgi:hypothetical protein